MRLTPRVKRIIDRDVDEIKCLLSQTNQHFKRIFFPISDDGLLGTGIFQVGTPVRRYITAQIEALREGDFTHKHHIKPVVQKSHLIASPKRH